MKNDKNISCENKHIIYIRRYVTKWTRLDQENNLSFRDTVRFLNIFLLSNTKQ